MDKQGKQLVKADPLPPPISKRRGLVVGGDDPLEVRAAEQPQHGKVGLPMPTVRGGVNEPDPVRPENVATPEVPMQPRRRLSRPGQLVDALTNGLNGRGIVKNPLVNGGPQVGEHPVLGIPPRPPLPGNVAHGRKPDPGLNRPTGRRDPKGLGPGPVERGKLPPKPLSRGKRGTPSRHFFDDKPLVIEPQHSRHLWTTTRAPIRTVGAHR